VDGSPRQWVFTAVYESRIGVFSTDFGTKCQSLLSFGPSNSTCRSSCFKCCLHCTKQAGPTSMAIVIMRSVGRKAQATVRLVQCSGRPHKSPSGRRISLRNRMRSTVRPWGVHFFFGRACSAACNAACRFAPQSGACCHGRANSGVAAAARQLRPPKHADCRIQQAAGLPQAPSYVLSTFRDQGLALVLARANC
jgi:hypothetical protein